MSTFYKQTKNPKTGKWEKALWMDDYFAHYHYGVKFPDGSVVDPEEVKLETGEGGDTSFSKQGGEITITGKTITKEMAEESTEEDSPETQIHIGFPEIEQAFLKWQREGRTPEQVYGVVNFLTGAGLNGIRAGFIPKGAGKPTNKALQRRWRGWKI